MRHAQLKGLLDRPNPCINRRRVDPASDLRLSDCIDPLFQVADHSLDFLHLCQSRPQRYQVQGQRAELVTQFRGLRFLCRGRSRFAGRDFRRRFLDLRCRGLLAACVLDCLHPYRRLFLRVFGHLTDCPCLSLVLWQWQRFGVNSC